MHHQIAATETRELLIELETCVARGLQSHLIGGQSGRKVEDVEQAIGQIEGHLSVFLKQQRNSATPIGRLSNELILEILQYSTLDDDKYIHLSHKKTRLNVAFSLCTRWWRIAVNTPSLWTTICLPMDPNLFRLFRDRSDTLPLKIYLSTRNLKRNESPEASMGDPLPQLLPRLSRLYVDWDDGDYDDFCTFLSTHIGHTELPCLTSLTVEAVGAEWGGDVYKINAPNLSEYRFNGMSEYVCLVHFDNLIKFELESFILEPIEILDLLSLAPRLEYCDISNTDSPLIRHDVDDLPVVVLNRLRSLSVRGLEVSYTACLVRHLDLPSTAALSFQTYRNQSAGGTTIEDFVGSFLQVSEGLSISCELDKMSSRTTYTLTSNSRAKIDITHTLSHQHAVKLPELEPLCAHATSLTTLTLHMATLASRSSLIAALNSWTQLTHIGVFTEEMQFEKLLSALEAAPGPLCPKLQSLNCSGTRFSSTRMKHFLQSRKDNDVPLLELKFTKGFAESNVAAFLSLVPTLTEFELDLSKCGFSYWPGDCSCNLRP